jgi:adenylate cyclase
VQVVDIDDSSLERVGGRPWSRRVMTTILDRLREAGAAVVGFDLKVAGPAQDEPSFTGAEIDERFAASIGRLPVVIGFMMTDADGNGEVIRKAGIVFSGPDFHPVDHLHRYPEATADLTALQSAAHGVGYANVHVDPDGRIRAEPMIAMLRGKPVPSFAAEVVRVAKGKYNYFGIGNRYGLDKVIIGNIPLRTNQAGDVWLHYGHSRPERFIHAADVLAGTFDRNRVAGRIVLVGVSAPTLGDQWPSPFGTNIPGVEILAQSIEQMLQGELLSRPTWIVGIEVLTAIVAAALVVAASSAGRVWALVAGSALVLVIVMLSGFAYVRWQVLMNPVSPALTIVIAIAGAALLRDRPPPARQQIEA